MTQVHDLQAIFREVLAALNLGDDEAAVDHFAEDGVVVDFSEPEVVHRGRDAIRGVIRGFREMLPDLAIDVIDVASGEDRLAAELRLRGTPSDGSGPIDVQFCTFYRFVGDKIRSEHVYMDPTQLTAAS